MRNEGRSMVRGPRILWLGQASLAVRFVSVEVMQVDGMYSVPAVSSEMASVGCRGWGAIFQQSAARGYFACEIM